MEKIDKKIAKIWQKYVIKFGKNKSKKITQNWLKIGKKWLKFDKK